MALDTDVAVLEASIAAMQRDLQHQSKVLQLKRELLGMKRELTTKLESAQRLALLEVQQKIISRLEKKQSVDVGNSMPSISSNTAEEGQEVEQIVKPEPDIVEMEYHINMSQFDEELGVKSELLPPPPPLLKKMTPTSSATTGELSLVDSATSKPEDAKKLFKCAQCDYSSDNRAYLVVHKGRVHVAKTFACLDCNMRFKRKTHLLYHQLTHSVARRHACGQCEKRFKRKGHLKEHALTQ